MNETPHAASFKVELVADAVLPACRAAIFSACSLTLPSAFSGSTRRRYVNSSTLQGSQESATGACISYLGFFLLQGFIG